jgi:hypothetical protein
MTPFLPEFPMSIRLVLAPAAVACAAGLALAGPAAAAPAGQPTELAQAAPATPPPGPPSTTLERRVRAMNPKAMCLDQLARRIGHRTYLKVKLDLKPDQVGAWDAFAKAAEAADARETARCNALPTEMKERPSIVDRMTMQEGFMKARLERIEAVKPSMTALYNALSPEQKTVLDGPMAGMGMGPGMMGGGMGMGGMHGR